MLDFPGFVKISKLERLHKPHEIWLGINTAGNNTRCCLSVDADPFLTHLPGFQ